MKILCKVSNLTRQLLGQALSSRGERRHRVAPANLNSSGARDGKRGWVRSLYAAREAGCLARQQWRVINVPVRGREEGFFFFHEPLVELLSFFSFSFSRQRAGTREPIFILKRDTRTPAHSNADFGRCGRYT